MQCCFERLEVPKQLLQEAFIRSTTQEQLVLCNPVDRQAPRECRPKEKKKDIPLNSHKIGWALPWPMLHPSTPRPNRPCSFCITDKTTCKHIISLQITIINMLPSIHPFVQPYSQSQLRMCERRSTLRSGHQSISGMTHREEETSLSLTRFRFLSSSGSLRWVHCVTASVVLQGNRLIILVHHSPNSFPQGNEQRT